MSHYPIFALSGILLMLINIPTHDSNYIFPYVQSQSIFENLPSNQYYVNHTNAYKCDFLNLCNLQNLANLNGLSDSYSKGIVDISYLKIDVNLPFP